MHVHVCKTCSTAIAPHTNGQGLGQHLVITKFNYSPLRCAGDAFPKSTSYFVPGALIAMCFPCAWQPPGTGHGGVLVAENPDIPIPDLGRQRCRACSLAESP